jgi:hypothetical protein
MVVYLQHSSVRTVESIQTLRRYYMSLQYYEGKEVKEVGMLLIFKRKVIPIENRVETQILGIIDGEPANIGNVNFPTKQTWTKFWGALQRGSLSVPDIEVRMENVPVDGIVEADEPLPKDPPKVTVVGKQV